MKRLTTHSESANVPPDPRTVRNDVRINPYRRTIYDVRFNNARVEYAKSTR